MKLTYALLATLTLAACGGGDDGGHPLDGRWSGELSLQGASAGCTASQPLQATFDITVNGQEVTAKDANGLQLQGRLLSPESFEAEFSAASAFVDSRQRLVFTRNEPQRAAAVVTFTERSFAVTCERTWSGTLAR